MYHLIKMLFLLSVIGFSLPASAILNGGSVASGPCPDYSVNMQVVPPPFEDPNHSCYTVNDSLGMAYLGAGSSWRGGHGEPVAGFDNAYVTYTGRYSLYLHLCPAAGIAKCTIRQSGYTIKSSRSLNINSVVPLGKQNLDFGGICIYQRE